jgi:hypothetical protein
MAAAWPGLAKPGPWDFGPLVWGGVLLLAAGLVGRVRWWGVLVAIGAGLPCDTIASHFGVWAGIAVVVAIAAVLASTERTRRPG